MSNTNNASYSNVLYIRVVYQLSFSLFSAQVPQAYNVSVNSNSGNQMQKQTPQQHLVDSHPPTAFRLETQRRASRKQKNASFLQRRLSLAVFLSLRVRVSIDILRRAPYQPNRHFVLPNYGVSRK